MPVPVLGLMFSAVLVSAPLPALVLGSARTESVMSLAPGTPADLTKNLSRREQGRLPLDRSMTGRWRGDR